MATTAGLTVGTDATTGSRDIKGHESTSVAAPGKEMLAYLTGNIDKNRFERTASAKRSGVTPPTSARQRYPVFLVIPTRRQVSTVPTPLCSKVPVPRLDLRLPLLASARQGQHPPGPVRCCDHVRTQATPRGHFSPDGDTWIPRRVVIALVVAGVGLRRGIWPSCGPAASRSDECGSQP